MRIFTATHLLQAVPPAPIFFLSCCRMSPAVMHHSRNTLDSECTCASSPLFSVEPFPVAGLLAVAFGPAYSHLLLRVAYGQRWSNTGAPAALAAYCPYILLLAANGILEAFVHAVASARRAPVFPACTHCR